MTTSGNWTAGGAGKGSRRKVLFPAISGKDLLLFMINHALIWRTGSETSFPLCVMK
jgi:hypothetical protein